MEADILVLKQRSQVQAFLLEPQYNSGEWKAGRGQGRICCLLLAAGVGCCVQGHICPRDAALTKGHLQEQFARGRPACLSLELIACTHDIH